MIGGSNRTSPERFCVPGSSLIYGSKEVNG